VNIRKRGTLPHELSFLQLTGKPVMVQRKKKAPGGAQRKNLRKQEKAKAAPQADSGPGAQGAHSGKSCTGTILILGVAVAQKNRCHLVGHLRMSRAR